MGTWWMRFPLTMFQPRISIYIAFTFLYVRLPSSAGSQNLSCYSCDSGKRHHVLRNTTGDYCWSNATLVDTIDCMTLPQDDAYGGTFAWQCTTVSMHGMYVHEPYYRITRGCVSKAGCANGCGIWDESAEDETKDVEKCRSCCDGFLCNADDWSFAGTTIANTCSIVLLILSTLTSVGAS